MRENSSVIASEVSRICSVNPRNISWGRTFGRLRNAHTLTFTISFSAETRLLTRECLHIGMHEGIYAQLTRPWRRNGSYRLIVFSHGCGDGRCEQVRLYLERMRTEDIVTVAAEAYEMVEEQDEAS